MSLQFEFQLAFNFVEDLPTAVVQTLEFLTGQRTGPPAEWPDPDNDFIQSHAARVPLLSMLTATLQMLANGWLVNAVLVPQTELCSLLARLRLVNGHAHIVGNRPNRVEHRAIKRRPSQHDLLIRPRAETIAALLARC